MTTRRDFLKSAASLALFTVVPRNVLGRGFIAPSDELTKGIIGVGGMGRQHIKYDGTRVVAMCDVDKLHLQKGASLVKVKARKCTENSMKIATFDIRYQCYFTRY